MHDSIIEYIVAIFINLFAINILIYKIAVENKKKQLQIINEYVKKMRTSNSPEKLKQYEDALNKLMRQSG